MNKIKGCLFKFWVYILKTIYIFINDRIAADKDDLYVVYFSNLNDDVYLVENGQEAIILADLLNHLNIKINRKYTKVLYGKVDIVFRYKIAKLMDIIFCFNATDEQKQQIYRYVADTPIRINKDVNK